MGGTWQLWLTSGVIAAAVAGLVNLPKIRGEGRKASAEADGERFGTYKATTDATIERLELDCAEGQTRLDLIEARNVTLEARITEQEQRERSVTACLRALVRAYDTHDPAARDDAITRARELI